MNEVLNLTEKQFNYYANIVILVITTLIVSYLYRRNNKNLNDIDSYDWNKYNIHGENRTKQKKVESKDKPKKRIKEYSKGNGFIKEENKFPVLIDNKENKFLNLEESTNFQDLINYAADMNKEKESNIYPIESLYSQVVKSSNESGLNVDEKIDYKINEIMQSDILDLAKANNVLSYLSKADKNKNYNLREQTYIGLVELFLRCGKFEAASFFLSRMDYRKISIPRKLLDKFLDYSIDHRVFEKDQEKVLFEPKPFNRKYSPNSNKFDNYGPKNPEYEYYIKQKNRYHDRVSDLNTIYNKFKKDHITLNINAGPYIPKRIQEKNSNEITKNTLNTNLNIDKEVNKKISLVDPSKVTPYVPKNFRVINVDEDKIEK